MINRFLIHDFPRFLRVFGIVSAMIAVEESGALTVEGMTLSGMSFQGKVVALRAESLLIEREGPLRSEQIGIPVESLASLSMGQPDASGEIPSGGDEQVFALMPYWNSTTLERFLLHVEFLCEQSSWQEAWRWADKLDSPGVGTDTRNRAAVLKAWALIEMGLWSRLGEVLDRLNIAFEPVEAPARLCWLNARAREAANDPEAALFWAQLPLLRIPSCDEPYASLCGRLTRRLQNGRESKFPNPGTPATP